MPEKLENWAALAPPLQYSHFKSKMGKLARVVSERTGAKLPLTLPEMVEALARSKLPWDDATFADTVGYDDAAKENGLIAWHYLIAYCMELGGCAFVTLDDCIDILGNEVNDPNAPNVVCHCGAGYVWGDMESTEIECDCGCKYTVENGKLTDSDDNGCTVKIRKE